MGNTIVPEGPDPDPFAYENFKRLKAAELLQGRSEEIEEVHRFSGTLPEGGEWLKGFGLQEVVFEQRTVNTAFDTMNFVGVPNVTTYYVTKLSVFILSKMGRAALVMNMANPARARVAAYVSATAFMFNAVIQMSIHKAEEQGEEGEANIIEANVNDIAFRTQIRSTMRLGGKTHLDDFGLLGSKQRQFWEVINLELEVYDWVAPENEVTPLEATKCLLTPLRNMGETFAQEANLFYAAEIDYRLLTPIKLKESPIVDPHQLLDVKGRDSLRLIEIRKKEVDLVTSNLGSNALDLMMGLQQMLQGNELSDDTFSPGLFQNLAAANFDQDTSHQVSNFLRLHEAMDFFSVLSPHFEVDEEFLEWLDDSSIDNILHKYGAIDEEVTDSNGYQRFCSMEHFGSLVLLENDI